MHDIGCPDSASVGMGCLPTLPPQVVHGGGNDSLWLQRDFGLFLVNVFDTEKACQVGRPPRVAMTWGLPNRPARACGLEGVSIQIACSELPARAFPLPHTACLQRSHATPTGAGLRPALAGLPAAALLRHPGRQEPGAAGRLAPAVRAEYERLASRHMHVQLHWVCDPASLFGGPLSR